MLKTILALCLFTIKTEAGGGGGGGGDTKSPVGDAATSGMTHEYRLIYDLLKSYSKEIRPIEHPGDLTYVFVEVSLMEILEVDTKNQQMRSNSEVISKWYDFHLKWDPADYGNMSHVRMPASLIWSPDVILYNTAEGDYDAGILRTNAIVESSGIIELISQSNFVSVCNMDVEWYPFDEQTCPLGFASWTYDEKSIVLVLGPADMSEFQENPEFYLEDFYADQTEIFNPCCEELMSNVNFYVQLQRRSKFSVFFFIIPGILINACAVMVFSLPAESGEKVTLGISAMLAMIVFLMEMTIRLPPTEKIPLVGMYYGACLCLVAVNIACGVAIANINVSGERNRKAPMWFRHLTLTLAKICLNKVPKRVEEKWRKADEAKEKERKNGKSGSGNWLDGRTIKVNPIDFDPAPFQKQEGGKDDEYTNAIDNQVPQFKDPFQQRSATALYQISRAMALEETIGINEDADELKEDEWKFSARVFDRFLFYVFTCIVIIFNIYLFVSSPYGEQFVYCPWNKDMCEGLSEADIMAYVHAGATGPSPDGPPTGGHGAPAAGGHGEPAAGGHGAPAAGDHGAPAAGGHGAIASAAEDHGVAAPPAGGHGGGGH